MVCAGGGVSESWMRRSGETPESLGLSEISVRRLLWQQTLRNRFELSFDSFRLLLFFARSVVESQFVDRDRSPRVSPLDVWQDCCDRTTTWADEGCKSIAQLHAIKEAASATLTCFAQTRFGVEIIDFNAWFLRTLGTMPLAC